MILTRFILMAQISNKPPAYLSKTFVVNINKIRKMNLDFMTTSSIQRYYHLIDSFRVTVLFVHMIIGLITAQIDDQQIFIIIFRG